MIEIGGTGKFVQDSTFDDEKRITCVEDQQREIKFYQCPKDKALIIQ